MVRIEISDSVWERYRLSWVLFGRREHQELVKMLEDDLFDKSNSVIDDDGERQLLDDIPEAYGRREIGLMKEDMKRSKRKQKTLDQF